ncbi:hypothetical protein YA0089_19055 [Pseudomonas viridiflava]|uniref:hypothetical protein n=1 Tax=Pseudomonas viridiflava TaxID=33069 RepID=UPI0018E61137|nr:hypothetical protein [Pseudomonas viridiflava]MBI6725707.1 hypothetical protein [Pseudomonas viridiflava]
MTLTANTENTAEKSDLEAMVAGLEHALNPFLNLSDETRKGMIEAAMQYLAGNQPLAYGEFSVKVGKKSQEAKMLSASQLTAAQDHLFPGDSRVKLEDVERLQDYQPLEDNLRCLATTPASSIKAFGIEWAGIVAATALDKLCVSKVDTGE